MCLIHRGFSNKTSLPGYSLHSIYQEEEEKKKERLARLSNQRQKRASTTAMTSNLIPEYAYTVVYVKDVAKSVAFYSKAFGYHVRRLDESNRWGELESGPTTIAFTPIHQRETDDRSGAVQTPLSDRERPPMEVCFSYTDVDAAYKRAVENGATPVSEPEYKEWGQRVGYVRDVDGIVVRMGSHVAKPTKQD